MQEKLSWFLENYYNLFHADLISRAMHDDSISLADFIDGVYAIKMDESENDEFVPEQFKNV